MPNMSDGKTFSDSGRGREGFLSEVGTVHLVQATLCLPTAVSYTASKILDPDTEERPIRRSQSPSNKHTASKTLDPDAEARPIGC